MFSFRIFFGVLFLLSPIVASSNVCEVKPLFEERFFTAFYVPNRCGQNIMKLVNVAAEHEIDLSNLNILNITAKGWVHIEGMVPYNARNQGRLIDPKTFDSRNPPPEHEIIRHPGETMWYFHVVLESEGYIIDFDFLNEPTITPVHQYFETMFYPKQGRTGYAAKKDFPDKVKEDYIVEVIPANDYYGPTNIEASELYEMPFPKLKLKDYLSKFAESKEPLSCEPWEETQFPLL